MYLRFLLAIVFAWTAPAGQATPPAAAAPDRLTALVTQIETFAAAGNREAVRALGSDMLAAADLALALTVPTPSRLVVRERDRTALPDGGHRMLLEVFWERGIEGRLSTWTVDVRDDGTAARVTSAARVAHVSGLYRLSLNRTRQFAVKDLTVEGTDLTLKMKSGWAFTADTPEGATAVVLLGDGEMHFAPRDAAERTQVRIFSRSEALDASFDAAFVRLRPEDFAERFPAAALTERPAVEADARRASALFEQYIGRTLQINLTDLSPSRWSITPQAGDMIAEVRTRRFGNLTYTRSRNDAEDVTLFDRRRRRNVSVYASEEKLARRGQFYSEDDLVDYDVLAYEIEAAISPDRARIDGTARLKVRIRSAAAATLNLRLNEELNVSGVYSPAFGRLLHLRVFNQNTLIVSLPGTMISGTELWLHVNYGGPLHPQELDREAIAVQQDTTDVIQIPPEPRFLYSNRSYWYPQSTVTDYASVKLDVAVPSGYDVVATGRRQTREPQKTDVKGRAHFLFETDRPVRYIACVVSRLRDVGSTLAPAPAGGEGTPLHMIANSRQVGRARSFAPRAADIHGFYSGLVREAPYPALSLVFTEREVPGGHSPAYFAVLDQPVQGTLTWRNDPVNFDNYPDFFMAHEIAHQWWGQAIGWKNYHEQWLSEGLAQYFAALYAEKKLAPGIWTNVIRKMRQTAMDKSSQGPIYLGYRLGHVQGDSTVFRSILYNKSAMVLHMMRLVVGDEAFFAGLRDFFATWKYRKAGTNDLQAAMEKASGRSLSKFFAAWIFGTQLPTVKFSHRTEGNRLTLRVEQQSAIEVPIPVRIVYRSGRHEIRVLVSDGPVTEQTLDLTEPVRSVSAHPDHGTLAVIR